MADDDVTLATGERLHRWDDVTPLAWEITVDRKRDPALGGRWEVRMRGPTAVLLEGRSTRREPWVRSAAKWRRLRCQRRAMALRDHPGAGGAEA